VFFDISIGKEDAGRIVIGLFGEVVPLTANNFKTLATTGVEGKTYSGSKFHRIIPNFMIQGGDVVSGNGMGAISKYGKRFADENFTIRHGGEGFLSMANSGPNSNGCQFFITLAATKWLDGKHVVFGKVVEGMDILKKIGALPTDQDDKPLQDVVITKSGTLPMSRTYQETDEPNNFYEWMKGAWIPIVGSMAVIAGLQYLNHQIKVSD